MRGEVPSVISLDQVTRPPQNHVDVKHRCPVPVPEPREPLNSSRSHVQKGLGARSHPVSHKPARQSWGQAAQCAGGFQRGYSQASQGPSRSFHCSPEHTNPAIKPGVGELLQVQTILQTHGAAVSPSPPPAPFASERILHPVTRANPVPANTSFADSRTPESCQGRTEAPSPALTLSLVLALYRRLYLCREGSPRADSPKGDAKEGS